MIYLDNNATTGVSQDVVRAMLTYLTDRYANPSAETAPLTSANQARIQAAFALRDLLHAEDVRCFAFTSGATESNNWVFSSCEKLNSGGRVIISAVEHASIANSAYALKRSGFELVEIPVNAHGVLRLDALAKELTKETVLVSIMAANNETGAIQPILEIGRLVRSHSPTAIFHTDATQAVGKMSINLQEAWEEVDMLSFSAHKFHGPKGVGGLYIRPGIPIEAMIVGGGQEDGLRSGTTNTPGLAGLAIAASEMRAFNHSDVLTLRDTFEQQLKRFFPRVVIHSLQAPRLPNTSYFSIPALSANDAVEFLAASGIIVATGAACSAGAIEPSKTLRAMGVQHAISTAAIRASFSRVTTMKDVAALIEGLRNALTEAQKLSLPSNGHPFNDTLDP